MKNPAWLKKTIVDLDGYRKTNEILKKEDIKTVCHSARCPNIYECFNRGRVTFMVLGDKCTRNCSFCSIKHIKENRDDIGLFSNEAENIIRAVKKLDLKYVVLTSPTRDDLVDGGAFYFANVVKKLKLKIKNVKIEILVPDFKGNLESICQVLKSGVDVFAHNIETVKRLYSRIRPEGDYDCALWILRKAKEIRGDVITKSSIMLGLGETQKEVEETLRDLRSSRVDGICIGQYLKPSVDCMEVKKFFMPEEFDYFYNYALALGFKFVACGPWVRSSYKAKELSESLMGAKVNAYL
jgi:lipoic acid synthetase